MKGFKGRYLFAAIFGTLLTAYTAYVALDTFVIERVYDNTPIAAATTAVTTEKPIETTTTSESVAETTTSEAVSETTAEPPVTEAEPSEPIITDSSYKDDNISIEIKQYRENETDIYVADVTMSSPEYLKTAFAKDTYGKNVVATTADTAEQNGAIFAVNGDYYGARTRGYVLRNGLLYRDNGSQGTEDLVIYNDGSFEVIDESDITAEELLNAGAAQILTFGPGLVIDGEISVDENDEVARSMTSNPRTAIGIIGEGHYAFVVSDGRTEESAGLSLLQLAEFMKNLGATTAYNLDGGGSATMWFNGSIINNPTADGETFRQRRVSDIVYIGY